MPGASLVPRHLVKGAAEAIRNAVGADPCREFRPQSAGEINQCIGGPHGVARDGCLCGPLRAEARGGRLNLGRSVPHEPAKKLGEDNRIPRSSD